MTTSTPASRLARPGTAWLLLAAILLSCALVASSASAAPVAGAPAATTGGVTNVRGSTGSLNGSVNPNGRPTEYFFQFGPTVAYGQETRVATLPAGFIAVKVALPETGLQAGWHYRIVAGNELGQGIVGKDRTYTLRASGLKVSLEKPNGQHVVGGSAVLSGVLTGTGAANHKVVLQAVPYPYTGAFVTVTSPATASATGRYSFTVKGLNASAEYRVATTDPRPIYSSVQTLPVSVRVTIHVQKTAHRGVVRLYGSVTPAEAGAKVFFQLQKPAKDKVFRSEKAEERAEEQGPHFASRFTSTAKRASSHFSRFSLTVTIKQAGKYRAYVQVKRGPLASGFSSTVSLKAAPGSQKKHRKH